MTAHPDQTPETAVADHVIVTDAGFAAVDPKGGAPLSVVELCSDADPDTAPLDADMIVVDFPSFADGRGFTIARRLRLRGYAGHLRARGHVIADQYAMARRSGFDDVAISAELAARQPQEQWVFRAAWQTHDYQSRLSAG
ncbi:DUF934 domain-containing protein [Pseudooceanicola aestuarii]|uniref:DUF934 domain-containing protein n=1 Tax=Pseudooceanicola aestuarii TaxID=2697319 RepID=UPI0013D8B2A0|nr:DUF934 domain-containing protein [Pseudooceanicola aestuarii]